MGDPKGSFPKRIEVEPDLASKDYDAILLISSPITTIEQQQLREVVAAALKIDPCLSSEVAILPLPGLPAGRLVHAPTGPIDPDYDDCRSFKEAAAKGVKRAVKAEIKKLMVVLVPGPQSEPSLCGVFEALYSPIHHREWHPSKVPKLELLGVHTGKGKDATQALIDRVVDWETGLHIARDVGGGDPERMTAINIEKYLRGAFQGSGIKMDVVSEQAVLDKQYPLFSAVDRCARTVERHRGRIIYLEYVPKDPSKVTKTLFLVGKGVTYDTGGADLKVGGIMVSMSRDKCGAAAVAGFLKVVDLLKPSRLRVVGALCLARNSIGSDCYVSDEVIRARSGQAVRISNTDAEGRMVMADVLCRMKEMAVDAVDPHLFTIATLTGHAMLAYGNGYSAAMDNGPARRAGVSAKLQVNGELIGDPIEISVLRREDVAFHKGKVEGEDILQCGPQSSGRTQRGHQGPAGFLLLASGLDKHGSGSSKPLKYTHIDIAASAGEYPQIATGSPVLTLAKTYLD